MIVGVEDEALRPWGPKTTHEKNTDPLLIAPQVVTKLAKFF